MAEITDDDPSGSTDRALRELLDEEHHRQLVEDRRRRSSLRRQADEEVSLADLLAAAGARGTRVVVTVGHGLLPDAIVIEAGRDFVALRDAGDDGRSEVRLVALAAISSVRLDPGAAVVVDGISDSGAQTSGTLIERLRELERSRPAVRLVTGHEVVVGWLRQVGQDVLIVEDEHGGSRLVVAARLAEVLVRG